MNNTIDNATQFLKQHEHKHKEFRTMSEFGAWLMHAYASTLTPPQTEQVSGTAQQVSEDEIRAEAEELKGQLSELAFAAKNLK